MKITSLFSSIPLESFKTSTENNDNKPCTTPNSKSLSSPTSSPDVILPSPVLEKKRATKAKRCISHVLVDDIEYKDKLTDTHSHFSKKKLDVSIKKSENQNNDVDSQPYSFDTVSLGSPNTEFSSDFFLDW